MWHRRLTEIIDHTFARNLKISAAHEWGQSEQEKLVLVCGASLDLAKRNGREPMAVAGALHNVTPYLISYAAMAFNM